MKEKKSCSKPRQAVEWVAEVAGVEVSEGEAKWMEVRQAGGWR